MTTEQWRVAYNLYTQLLKEVEIIGKEFMDYIKPDTGARFDSVELLPKNEYSDMPFFKVKYCIVDPKEEPMFDRGETLLPLALVAKTKDEREDYYNFHMEKIANG